MKQLIEKVIQWADARYIYEQSTPLKQHDKLIEEVVEIRDAIAEKKFVDIMLEDVELETDLLLVTEDKARQLEDEIRDGIGDSVVVIINLCAMQGMEIPKQTDIKDIGDNTVIHLHDKLLHHTIQLRLDLTSGCEYAGISVLKTVTEILEYLKWLAWSYDWTLEQCLQVAYDEIKDRKGMMIDGSYVKYANLTDEQKVECDRRLEVK